MKKFALFAVAAALALSSCSSSTDGNNGFEAAQPENSTAVHDPLEAGVGDTLVENCYSHLPCDAEFKITGLTLTDECTHDYNNFGSTERDLKAGEVYFEMEGEFSVKSSEKGWAMLDDPKFVDADGFTQQLPPAFYCHAEAPFISWSDPLDVGQKARPFGAWIIPADASHVLLYDRKIMLANAEQFRGEPAADEPVLEESAAPAAPAPAPALTSQAPAPAPAAPRAPVGFTGAPNGDPQPLVGKVIDYCMTGPVQPGSTMFTDGTTGWTTECAG